MENCDKENIKNDIQTACQQQEQQRRYRIAKAARNSGKNIVIGAAENTEKYDDEIGAGHAVDFRRRAKRCHQRMGKERPQQHDSNSGEKGERDSGPHCVGEISLSLAPKYWDAIIPPPLAIPINSTNSRFKTGPLAPTAASALSPTKRPTAIESTVLYICCARLPISRRMENCSRRESGRPTVTSCAEKNGETFLCDLLLFC